MTGSHLADLKKKIGIENSMLLQNDHEKRKLCFGEASTFTSANGSDNPPTSLLISEVYYAGCSSEDIALASTLVKWYPVQTLGDSITYTTERHGQVPAVYVKEFAR